MSVLDFQWPSSVGAGFAMFASDNGVTLDGSDSFDSFDLAAPSPSQTCLNLLDPQVRLAYNMAYTFAKSAHVAGEYPNWAVLLLEESYANTPQPLQDRMKAHFDRYFETVNEGLSAAARANANPNSNADLTSVVSDPVVGPAASNELGSSTGTSKAASPCTDDRPGLSSAPSHNAFETVPLTQDLVPRASSAASGQLRSSSGTSVSPTSTSGPSELRNRVTRMNNSLPALSNAARAALLGSGPLHKLWEYRGIVRWGKGRLSEEVPLTFQDVERLVENASTRSVRERWQCRLCESIRHESVGSTTNLTKHHKLKCSALRAA